MRIKFLLTFVIAAILATEGKNEDKIDTSAEGNEIPHEKYDKTKVTKYSDLPLLIVKELQTENNTTPETVQEIATQTEGSSTLTSKEETPTTKKFKTVLVCPHKDEPKPLFSLPCFSNSNCGFLGSDVLCCEGRCLKSTKVLKEDAHQAPILFGIIQGKCPTDSLTEFSEIKTCTTDDECSPRICCEESRASGENNKYCRTPIPIWDTVPLPSPVLDSLKAMTSYMQCTQPPPPHLDLYPKSCQNPMDCFPNLCCQEKDKKVCRPPKRSLLTLVAEVGQRIIPEEAARKFIERIS